MEDSTSGETDRSDAVRAEIPSRWFVRDSRTDERGGVEDEGVLAALIAVLSMTPGARGLWRAWLVDLEKTDLDGEAEPLYVAEAAPDGAAALATSLQDAARVGGDAARVEVVATGQEIPEFQREAQVRGELLWASDTAPVITVARVFDGVLDNGEPFFALDHDTLVDADERAEVLGYLRAATTLMTTQDAMRDIVDPDRGSVVPINFRSDGKWIWPDATEYYLEEYQLAPDGRLVEHIRASGGSPPQLDAVAEHRALSELLRAR